MGRSTSRQERQPLDPTENTLDSGLVSFFKERREAKPASNLTFEVNKSSITGFPLGIVQKKKENSIERILFRTSA